MKKKLFIFTLSIFVASLVFAQKQQEEEEETVNPATVNAQQIYAELLGPGIFYSINYDTRFGKKEKGLGMRVGMGAVFTNGSGLVSIPVGLNYLAGRKGKYLEVGGGLTYLTAASDGITNGGGVLGFATFGYRRQPYKQKDITWRLAFDPLLVFNDKFSLIPYFGFSLGYRF
jgi:hypothetical protein